MHAIEVPLPGCGCFYFLHRLKLLNSRRMETPRDCLPEATEIYLLLKPIKRSEFQSAGDMRRTRCLTITFLLLNATHLSGFDDHGREIRPASWREDATINDVFFINATHGWAVGDQGLILKTVDGGERWTSCQNAGLDLDDHRSFEQKLARMRPISRAHELYPLTCSLKCVHFIDEKQGWIAGNYYTPYLQRSHCVLLKTVDGGHTWRTLPINFLPQINRLHFQSLLGGWALGRKGSLYNSGVITTSSGGRTWSAQSIDPPQHLIDGDLIPSGFVVVDDQGRLGKIVGKHFQPAAVVGPAPGRLKSVRMQNANIGWAAGTSGTILMTRDGGASWAYPPAWLNSSPLGQFDFSTISISDQRVWIAGNPGTYVVSLDAATGDDLQFHATAVSMPIRKVFFSDEQHGWAVGAHGMVLATTDQGQHWNVQRMANDQVGILVFSDQTANLPFALMSYFANEKGILSGSVVLGEHDALNLDIAAAANARVGCSLNFNLLAATQAPDSPVEHEEAMKKMVRTIRTLRPHVLVCNAAPSSLEFAAVCQVAIEQAADPAIFPDQLQEAGLPAWQVDRFLIRTRSGTAALNLDGKQYLPRSGQLLEDQIAISRGLIQQSPVYDQPESYRVQSFTGSISAVNDDVFFGLEQLGRQIPTRKTLERWGNLSSIATAPLKHREMELLLQWPTDTPAQNAELQKQISAFGTTQEARELGIWLMQLAELFVRAGKLESAAYTLEQMTQRVGDHALTPAALVWLTQYYASSEIGAALYSAYRSDQEEPSSSPDRPSATSVHAGQLIATTSIEDGVQKIVWKPATPESNEGLIDASIFDAEVKDPIAALAASRMQLASRFLERLKQRDPDLAQSEPIQFMEANLASKLPSDTSAENLLKRIRRTGELTSEYAFAASRELRLRDRQFGLPGVQCFGASTRPLLDGRLDDALWQHALEDGQAVFRMTYPTRTDEPSRTDTYCLAHDEEFLFLAVRCNKILGQSYPPGDTRRSRDPDLKESERIQLILDFDRDFQSNFTLEIDARGRAADHCSGSPGWNPQWFVAANQDSDSWTIECAIPLRELTFQPVDDQQVAAFSIRRLNSQSIDLWSDEKDRTAHSLDLGIVAGLKIRPRQYELLRFSALATDTQETSNLE